jgi:DNA-binding NarL/FixJ family response regulator
MVPIQLLLIDACQPFRESLRRLLIAKTTFDVVSDCGTVDEACEILERSAVDVILLDSGLPSMPTRDCLSALRRAHYEGQILIVTAGMSVDESWTAMELGAGGVFFKHSSLRMLEQAIRLVADGTSWLDPEAMRGVGHPAGEPLDPLEHTPLTGHERDVLQRLVEGLGNKDIATSLGVSETGVKATLQQLFQKTGLRTRRQLVRIAVDRALVTAGSKATVSESNPAIAGDEIGIAETTDLWSA